VCSVETDIESEPQDIEGPDHEIRISEPDAPDQEIKIEISESVDDFEKSVDTYIEPEESDHEIKIEKEVKNSVPCEPDNVFKRKIKILRSTHISDMPTFSKPPKLSKISNAMRRFQDHHMLLIYRFLLL
jgi:hypothetical protein